MKNRGFRSVFSLLMVASLFLAACATSTPAPAPAPAPTPAPAATPAVDPKAEWEKVIVEAKKEGKLMIYTTFPLAEMTELLKMFNAEYGITGEIFRGGSGPVVQRFEQEQTARRYTADVLSVAGMASPLNWIEKKWVQPVSLPEAANYSEKYADPKGYWHHAALSGYSLMYNTKLVKPEDVPKRWVDLADPKWKGKFAMSTPWQSGTVLEALYMLESVAGLKDIGKMWAANQPLLLNPHATIATAIANGEVYMGLMNDYEASQNIAKGLPVGNVYLAEGATITPRPFVVTANAPHPNAAKLFVNWLLSLKTQTKIQEMVRYHSGHKDAGPPPGLPKLSEVPNPVVLDATKLQAAEKDLIERWQVLLGSK